MKDFLVHSKKIVVAIIALAFLYVASKMMLKGAGLGFSGKHVFPMMILIIFMSASKRIFWFLAFPMCVIYALYSPIGFIFGKPSYQYIASIFSTDTGEMWEFLLQIPYIFYLYPPIIIFCLIIYRTIIVKFNIQFYKNKSLIAVLALIAMLNQTPLEFFKDSYKSIEQVAQELHRINNPAYSKGWDTSEINRSSYKNNILVIGESARKDYHAAYGYPIENTPFLSTSNGLLVDGLTSSGSNTIASLRLMLTKPDPNKWEPNYNLNIVDLAKSAGLDTYWLSNQGNVGKFDTPISLIARKSNYVKFLKDGDHDSKNTSDFELLEDVKSILKQSNPSNRFIVIHLYGSHSSACERIVDFPSSIKTSNPEYAYLNCYVSSIEKTDLFLSKLNDILLDANESYSMVYFADHGMGHFKNEGQDFITLVHAQLSSANYSVPLFRKSSDDTNRSECQSFKLGINFVDGIAAWLGIKNTQINTNYDLFDCTDDPHNASMNKYLPDIDRIDPAIDIRDHS